MKLKLLVGIAAVLGILVIWQLMQSGAPQIDELDTHMEELRASGDIETLTVETKSPDIRTARRAVESMGYIGLKAVRPIRRAMEDPRPEIRQQAATAYARAADPKEAAPLAKVARDDQIATVRAAAVTGLGRTRAYEEMETLLAAMDDEDIVVRRRAAEAVVLLIGRRYPYNPNDSSARRQKSIDVIRKFWAKAKGVAGQYYDRDRKRRKEAAGNQQ